MGFESFRVELRRDVQGDRQLSQFVRELAHATPDLDTFHLAGSDYFIVDDGMHKFEIETEESRGRISCRFALCHPPTVDGAFINLIRRFVDRLKLELRIAGDESQRWYASHDFADFARDVLPHIASQRCAWIAQCGPAQLAATASEAFDKFILPLCEPVTSSSAAPA